MQICKICVAELYVYDYGVVIHSKVQCVNCGVLSYIDMFYSYIQSFIDAEYVHS